MRVCVASCGAWPLKYVCFCRFYIHTLTFRRSLSQRTPIVTHTETHAHAVYLASFSFLQQFSSPLLQTTLIQSHVNVTADAAAAADDDDGDVFVVVFFFFQLSFTLVSICLINIGVYMMPSPFASFFFLFIRHVWNNWRFRNDYLICTDSMNPMQMRIKWIIITIFASTGNSFEYAHIYLSNRRNKKTKPKQHQRRRYNFVTQ